MARCSIIINAVNTPVLDYTNSNPRYSVAVFSGCPVCTDSSEGRGKNSTQPLQDDGNSLRVAPTRRGAGVGIYIPCERWVDPPIDRATGGMGNVAAVGGLKT